MFIMDSSLKVFFYCILIVRFFDFSSLFPVHNCKTPFKRILAFLDCQGEMDQQRIFMKTFSNYLESMHTLSHVDLKFAAMVGNQCPEIHGVEKLDLVNYNGSLPFNVILKESKQWIDSEEYNNCAYFSLTFIFFFKVKDINNDKNPFIKEILENINENRAYNIFFIIQSSENPTYKLSTMECIHFTKSFKIINIKDIFNKICDMNPTNNTLSYSGKTYVRSEYAILNSLSKMSSIDVYCYCIQTHGMKLISLESYDEFVDIIQYINNSSIVTNNKEMNLHLMFQNSFNKVFWDSDNPYTFSNSSRIVDNQCFYLNLSDHRDTILVHDKTLYYLGQYMLEIDCYEPLQHSLVVCEGDNVIPEIYDQQNIQINTKTDKTTLTIDQTNYILEVFNGKYFYSRSEECIYDYRVTDTRLNTVICISYRISNIDKEINYVRNSTITLVYKSNDEMYYINKIDISKCEKYNECQTMSSNKIDEELSYPDVKFLCFDVRNNPTFNNTCSIRTLNLNYTLEYVQCESNKSQYSRRCIKENYYTCEDNSHLRNCENFICPEPLIKCLNSYCIFPHMIRNNNKDCPHGEDELLGRKKVEFQKSCYFHVILKFGDFCLDSMSFQDLIHMKENNTQFVCDTVCPKNYKCVSGKIAENFSNGTVSKIEHHQLKISPYVKINTDIVRGNDYDDFVTDSPLFTVVSLMGRKCSLTNFDYQLQNWKLKDLFILDISFNKINHSNYIKSVEKFTHLKLLNLSRNEYLIINQLFNFPRSLEILDLSYTKINALRNQVFKELDKLRHLDLSHTFITKFKDMGLPEYFILDTLYIRQLKIEQISKDFFKGLTINGALIASDYVICCSKILNSNISIHKCHAPIDFISSCKHLLGDTFKRIVIWVVGALTIVGNGIVLVYRIGWNREIFRKAYGLFVTGLAISDILMGFYLIIIAIADIYYNDIYFLEDYNWRKSCLCSFCGFLSTLSSEASTFFICLITVDRFLCVTYLFGEHTFSKTGKILSFALVWCLSFAMALIPVVLSDWEIYSSNGLCLALPFSPAQNKGWKFSFVIFIGLNFALFLFIGLGQLIIFINLIKIKKSISSATQNNQSRSDEWSVAKKLAFVAFTDFCCWFPVGILGLLSLNGYIFNREVYAWIAVFVLPINSALNPIIYTIPAVFNKCKTLRLIESITLTSR